MSNKNNNKDPSAVALGRKGGLKGGKARAEKLTKSERSSIARKAARARWNKVKQQHEDSVSSHSGKEKYIIHVDQED